MAFIRRRKTQTDNEQNSVEGPIELTSSVGVGGSAPSGGMPTNTAAPTGSANVTRAPSGRETSSGYFTDLQKYIQGNRESAERLGQRVASGIETERGEAEQAVTDIKGQFETEFGKGMPKYDVNLEQRLLSDPRGVMADEEAMARIGQIRSGQYTGPSDISQVEGYQERLKELKDIENIGQMVGTAGGRKELIKQLPGYNLASAGGLSLDQLLLQNVRPALQTVTGAAEGGKPVLEELERYREMTSKLAEPAGEIAKKNKERLEAAIEAERQRIQSDVESTVKQKREQEVARQERIRRLLEAATTKPVQPQPKEEAPAPQPEVGTTSPGSWNQIANGVWRNTVTGEMSYGQSPPSTQQPPAQQNLPNNGWTQVASGVWRHNVTGEMGYGQAPPPPITPTAPEIDDTYLGEPIMMGGPGSRIRMEPGMEAQGRAAMIAEPKPSVQGQPVEASTDRIRATGQGRPVEAPETSGLTTAELVNLYAAEPERFNENLKDAEEGRVVITQPELDLLGLSRDQWDALVERQREAAQAGIDLDLESYLTAQSPEALYTTETVMTPEQQDRLNALRQLQGMSPLEFNLPPQLKPYQFDVSGATGAIDRALADVVASEQEAAAGEQAAIDAGTAATPKKPKKPSSTESTLKGAAQGAAIGAQVGGPIGAAIGGVIGGVVGNITCFVAGTKLLMDNGKFMNVEDLKLNDVLAVGGRVTGTGTVLSNYIFSYKGEQMDGSHVVYEDGNWLRVDESELSERILTNDDEPVIVYPVICDNHIMITKSFASADMIMTDEPWSMTEEDRIDSLNKDINKKEMLDELSQRLFA